MRVRNDNTKRYIKRFFKDTTSLKKFFKRDISGIKVFTGLSNIAESIGLIAYLSKESGLQCHIKDIIDCGLLFFLVSFE